MRTFPRQNSAFTLIELLIVMAVLGVLAAIVIVTFPAGTLRARDAQRKSDLSQYRTELEKYANRNQGFYPRRSGVGGNTMTTLCGDLGVASDECVNDTKDNKNACDTNKCRYYYRTESCLTPGDPCAQRYVLFAALEDPRTDGYYWGVCSNGKTGEFTSANLPSDLDNLAACPI